MKYIIIAVTLGILILLLIWYKQRKKWAVKKVKCLNTEEKCRDINFILNPFGFEFDAEQDIVISRHDCWQREIGYIDLFDLKSHLFNIVMDCEPIYFHYNQKEYRIEFWKGQYGITSGAEIGIYIREDNCSYPKNYYRCANDEEQLEMGFLLLKKCTMFHRSDHTWWLTGFDVGKFSKPKNLQLKTYIAFPNHEMQWEFIKGLEKAGYPQSKIYVCENKVYFEYCYPHNYKLNHGHKLGKCFAQIRNYINCSIFLFFTKVFPTTLDKLTYIRFMFPKIYRCIINHSIPRKKQKKYCKKQRKS